MNSEEQVRRALLHPLRDSGIGGTASIGRWEPLTSPEELMRVAFPEDNPGLGGRVSSVPSPWARLELFRDAIAGAPVNEADTDSHPFTSDAVQDILDSLELLLYQDWMEGLAMGRHGVNLDELVQVARDEREEGVLRFVRATRDLAPRVVGAEPLRELTIVTDARANLLFGTSPFTLFFTPEDQTPDLPGYFATRPGPRMLRERPPELANYVAHALLPRLRRHESQLPELGRLVGILERQLEAVHPAWLQQLPDETFDERGALQPVPGVGVGRVTRLAWESRLTLVPTRPTSGTAPLVLNDEVLRQERVFFPWVEPPQGTRVVDAASRTRLPGTAWKHPWVDPERDFLVEHLLVLQRSELDPEAVLGREIYAAMEPRAEGRRPGQVLLPLTAEYFRYFGPEDALRHLRLAVDPSGRVVATLSVPTSGGVRTVRKTYTRGENLASGEFYLSVWPSFAPAPGQLDWHYYGILHHTRGRNADEFAVVAGVRGGERSHAPGGGEGGRPMLRCVRETEVAFHYLDEAPEYLRVRMLGNPGAGEPSAEGVIFPRFDPAPAPTADPWTVAVDLGTSNTVVAVHTGGEDDEPRLLHLRRLEGATRRDLMRFPDEPVRGARSDEVRSIDTFFFPDELRPGAFPTVVLKSQVSGETLEEDRRRIPALTANIPFTGDVEARKPNVIVDGLKWGGGLVRAERTLLTELFLDQVLLLVRAEAVRAGARVDGLSLRWSYPSAFSLEEQQHLADRWAAVLRWLRESRLGSVPGAPAAAAEPPAWLPDESTAALWYLERHREFTPNADPLAFAVDLGGGTTDIAGYAKTRGQFRNSILLGGRDLVGWPPPENPDAPLNPMYRTIEAWAYRRMGQRSAVWVTQLERTLPLYPTSHAKFSYLVRQPWFTDHRAELKEEPWFRPVQACIVYFFGAMFFHLGLLARTDMEGGERGYEPPDRMILGGNGSRFLEWLSGFQPWETSAIARLYEPVFQALFEAGYGNQVTRLRVLTSAEPKHEVALGLLSREADVALRPRTRRERDDEQGAGEAESIRKLQPVGEVVRIEGRGDVYPAKTELEVASGAVLSFGKDFEQSQIAQFNRAFMENLGRLRTISPEWEVVRDQLAPVLRECNHDFYTRAIRNELKTRLTGTSGRITPSVYAIEVSATLRRLQTALFAEESDG